MALGTKETSATPHFASLVMRQAEPLYAYVSRRIPADMRGWFGAEDVLQEVWSSAFNAWPEQDFAGTRDIERWLMTITKRKLVDAIKTARRLKRGGGRMPVRAVPSRASTQLDLFGKLSASGRTPSSTEAAAEAVAAVQIALHTLRPEYREAITLTHIEGKPEEEVAALMNRSVPALRGLVFRGLSQMRERIGEANAYFSDADLPLNHDT